MPLFGSHLSIAGGYYKAVDRAGQLGFDTVQIFTKNNNQWRAKPITDAEVEQFETSLKKNGIKKPISHDSYLINLASPDDELWNKSIDAMVVELERAHQLGIWHVVAHPGSHVGTGEAEGIKRIINGLNIVFERTKYILTSVCLETTAGQGTNLGYHFRHLGAIIKGCGSIDRLTACIDTCHVFAAGYYFATKDQYEVMMEDFDQHVGINRLVAWHLNDSKKELGSRVDRHEHIGKGCIGLEPFRAIVNDIRMAKIPMYLETAKEVDPESGREWDEINLDTLKSLLQ
ncbi:deoxyribonuclease IV [bacterium]|nr:deoxyribonuclease IV [bacterium]